MMTSPQGAFGDYQLEIYGAGLSGVLPRFPMAFAELEARAEQALPPSVLSYVAGGAGSEHTQRANVSAFRQWGLIPRMFVGAAQHRRHRPRPAQHPRRGRPDHGRGWLPHPRRPDPG